MSPLSLIPAGYRIAALALGAAALAAAGAAVTWWGLSPRIDMQARRAAAAEQGMADAQALAERQQAVLEQHQTTLDRIAEVDRQIQALAQTIRRNQAASAAALEELKRNDKTVADYLATAVPAALGRLYARPETTDPGAYRAGSAVQPGPVPATRQGAAGDD